MKILAISIAPIFKGYIHGGSQRIFLNVMESLSKNNQIKTYCTKRGDNCETFKFNKNFEVYPILPFRQFFPFPYMTNPKNIVDIIKIIKKGSEWADCIYIHADGYLLKNFLDVKIPIVTSYHDFIYPITISSAFSGYSDKIIIPSKYLFECFKNSIGNVFENIMQRTELINNGIDEKIFFKDNSKTNELKLKLKIKDNEKIILFPHRPEVSKGIVETINLLENLLKSGLKIRLLFPEYIDCKYDESIKKDYSNLKKDLMNRGLLENVSFFDWIPYNEMRHIYSLANLTLNLGNFVEAFGLVPLESLLCETPVICTKAGSLRYNLPNLDGVTLINYNDNNQLLEEAKNILKVSSFDFSKIHLYIKTNFNYEEMLMGYTKLFNGIKKAPPIKVKMNPNKIESYILSPWCYLLEDSVYDDYLGDYIKLDENTINTLKSKKIFFLNDFKTESLIKQNILVPNHDN
jgi:glycosyltransferase involved in cell wall biosynthesis